MLPFMFNLTGGSEYRCYRSEWPDLVAIECVTPRCGLGMNRIKIIIDSQAGSRVQLKTFKLRVVSITNSFVAQHGTSQQCLAPQSHQAAGIKILGMNRPKSHW